MIVLGLAPAASSNVNVASVPTTGATGRSTSQQWALRKERVKDSQNRQCLFCGRSEARYRKLEIHHVRKQEHGGSGSWSNTAALCGACHTLVHNVGNRETPLVGRIILAWQIIGPRESRFVTSICRLLFRCFLCAAAGNAFHPSALRVRTAVQLPGGGEVQTEAV
jgi:ribosomal protein S14